MSGYHDFAFGEQPTALTFDDFIGKQVIMRFADVTDRNNQLVGYLRAGMRCYTVAELTEWLYDGTGWVIMSEPLQSFTSLTIDQGASTAIARTVHYGKFCRSNGLCKVWAAVALTAGGTAGSAVVMSVPVNLVAMAGGPSLGAGMILDSSTGLRYVVQVEYGSTTRVGFGSDQGGSSALWGQVPNLALASTDAIRVSFEYEMTTRYS